MTLDQLVVRLVLDVTGFTAGQKAATDSLGKTKDEAVKSAKAVEASALAASQGVEKLARQFLGLYALVTGGRELKQFVSDITAADAAVGRTAKNIDMSGKALSTWQGVAVATGGSAEGITASMSGLSNAMQTAALTGENKLAPVFRALGVNLATTGGKARDIGAIMFDLNRRYNEMHIDPARFSTMMKMVGMDDGTINLLERSQSEFRKLYDEQQKYAAGAEDLDAAQKRQDGWRSLILTSTSFGRTILTAVTPAIVEVMKGVQGWANANEAWIRTAIVEKVGEFVTWLRSLDWNAIGKGAQDFGREVVGIATALRDTAKEVGADSALFKAFEVFGALLIGSKVLGAINTVTAAVTAFGRLPVPPLLAKMLGLAGAVAVGASAESTPDAETQKRMDDFYKEHPDASANPFDGIGRWWKGNAATWAGGDSPEAKARADDTARRQAEANAATEAANAKSGQSGGFWAQTWNYFKGKVGLGDDPRTKENIEDTAKATKETRDILKRQADAATLGGAADGGSASGASGVMGGVNRILRNAAAAAGAGFGTSRSRPAKGALAANQKEAYAAALKEGLSPTAARALVANMSGEGLAVPHDYHWDSTHMAQGIVQWDPTRSARIAAQFGKQPKDMSVAEQTKAAIWEMRTRPEYAVTARALQGDDGPAMIDALVDNYERPGNRGKAKAERYGYYRGFNPSGTPAAAPTAQAPVPAATSAKAVTDAEVFAARQRITAGGRDPKDQALIGRYLKEQNTPPSPVVQAAAQPKAAPMASAAGDSFGAKPGPEVKDGGLKRRGHMETYDTKGPNGPISTTDYRDLKFAPHALDPARQKLADAMQAPHPLDAAHQKLADAMRAGASSTPATPHVTWHHFMQQVLGSIRHAQRLTHHNDNRPVPVIDKDAMKLRERTAGKFDHAKALMNGHAAALDYHRAIMAGTASHHSSVTHTAHHYDYSTDTKIGSIAVHTQAKDARQVADDLRPYLFQGRDARQANRGLA